jgi:four helix bundle protein
VPAITHFEDIDAWQKARQLCGLIYQITNRGEFARDFGLRDQVRRAGVSTMANIAEGFERGGNPELIQFLSTAKGSVGEVKSHLYVGLDAGFISPPEFEQLYRLATDTGNLIGGFMRYLEQSAMRGAKFQHR